MGNDEIAMVCHQVNKAFCEAIGDNSQPEWELAPKWQRESAINGVIAHIESGLKMLPEDSHVSWMEEKKKDGWVYGPVKNPELKEHPCLIEYKDLPVEQKAKDYLFREVVHCLVKLRETAR